MAQASLRTAWHTVCDKRLSQFASALGMRRLEQRQLGNRGQAEAGLSFEIAERVLERRRKEEADTRQRASGDWPARALGSRGGSELFLSCCKLLLRFALAPQFIRAATRRSIHRHPRILNQRGNLKSAASAEKSRCGVGVLRAAGADRRVRTSSATPFLAG